MCKVTPFLKRQVEIELIFNRIRFSNFLLTGTIIMKTMIIIFFLFITVYFYFSGYSSIATAAVISIKRKLVIGQNFSYRNFFKCKP